MDRLQKAEDLIKELDTKVKGFEAAITAATEKATENEAAIATNTSAIEASTTKIGENMGAIGANE